MSRVLRVVLGVLFIFAMKDAQGGEHPPRLGVAGLRIDDVDVLEFSRDIGCIPVVADVQANEVISKGGKYDWTKLDRFIAAAVREQVPVYLRIGGNAGSHDAVEGIKAGKESQWLETLAMRCCGKTGGYILSDGYATPAAFKILQYGDPSAERVLELSSVKTAQHLAAMAMSVTAVALNHRPDVIIEADTVASLRRAFGNVPVWSMAMAPTGGQKEIDEATNMRTAVCSSVISLANGAAACFRGPIRKSGATPFGFFTSDGLDMRIAWVAFGNMYNQLVPFERVETIQDGSQIRAYRFHQKNSKTTVVWAADPFGGATWAVSPSGKLRIFDICGSLAKVRTPLSLNPEPLYLVEESVPRPERARPRMHLVKRSKADAFRREAVGEAASPGKAPRVLPGWDWSLPPGVEPTGYSGFFTFGEPTEDIPLGGWHPRWKDFHVGPNKFDFSKLQRRLDDAQKKGYRIGLRLMSVNRQAVPDWIIERYHPPIGKLTSRFRHQIVPPWHEDVRREFENFVREFGRRGFQHHPAFCFLSIHGISNSTGEELSLTSADIDILERDCGLTPELFRTWVINRIQTWSDAFGNKRNKLAWVGHEHFCGLKPYDIAAREAVELSCDLGIGGRGGFIEMYHYQYEDRMAGQHLTKDGYLITDEKRTANNCYFADENEEYLSVKRWRFGMLEDDPHRYRVSTLRALQMRRNFIALNSMSLDIDRQLSEYMRHSLGKTVQDTADVWCCLREGYVQTQEGISPIKNLERWMQQRDFPGGMTKPVARVDRTYALITDPKGMQYEFDARSTDRSSGNDSIYFDIDDRFANAREYSVKVTYVDDQAALWCIEYTDRNGKRCRTVPVNNLGDGSVKTATFGLGNVAFDNQLPHQQDFRIHCLTGDVAVKFVRVIRPVR